MVDGIGAVDLGHNGVAAAFEGREGGLKSKDLAAEELTGAAGV